VTQFGGPGLTVFSNKQRIFLFLLFILFLLTNFYPCDIVSAVCAMATWLAGWLAGWVSVTRQYCIKTAKPILKLFRPSGSPHHSSFFWPLCRYSIPREPLQWGH